MKLFAFANRQNSTAMAGTADRGDKFRKTRMKICSGGSNRSALSTCTASDMYHSNIHGHSKLHFTSGRTRLRGILAQSKDNCRWLLHPAQSSNKRRSVQDGRYQRS